MIKWHINVENRMKEHKNALCYISRLSSVFSIAYTHNSQCLPSQKTTHLMFFRDSHKSWGLSIANWCRIGPAHELFFGRSACERRYRVTCMCIYPFKEHMYVTTSIEQHIHAFILRLLKKHINAGNIFGPLIHITSSMCPHVFVLI